MRSITLISLIIIGLSCMSPKNVAAQPVNLNGTWVPVQQEMEGNMLPESSFENQKLVLLDSTYTFIGESVDKGIVRYRDKELDIYGTDGVNTGKHFTAIFKFEHDQLSVCYNLKGDAYPESFETTGKPLFFLSVFKKAKVK